MTPRKLISLTILPLALSSAYSAHAGDAPTITVTGFGSGALTWTDSSEAQFARPNQASGVTTRPRTGVDSNLGLQANVAVNDWLSATAQGLVRKDGADDFGAELAWAFAKAKLSDNLSVRVGRMGLPAFMISDYRNVGYANTMLRPPGEMYTQVPMNSIDGVDATWQRSFGDTTLSAQVALGSSRADIASSSGVSHLRTSNIRALNLVLEHGPVTARLGRVDGKLTVRDATSLNALLGGLTATGKGYGMAGLVTLADALNTIDKRASFTSAGLALDWRNVVLQSEYAQRRTDTWVNDTNSWYLMAGYRIGKFLPYVNHATTRSVGHVENTVPAACPVGYPAACTPTLQALSAGVNTLSAPANQSTDSIGVRWDVYRSLAMKVQFDRVRPRDNAGLLLNAAPGFRGPVTVGAVSLDFVF
jgi:hypothetical protein